MKAATIAGLVGGGSWSIGGNIESLAVLGDINGVAMTVGSTLTSAKLGNVRGSTFSVGTLVASFTCSTFVDSRLHVGFTPIHSADPMLGATRGNFDSSGRTRIDSFTVTANTPAVFAGSTIAACQLGKVALSRVATTGPTRIGVMASHSIDRVEVGRPALRVANRKAPCDLGRGQFRVRIV